MLFANDDGNGYGWVGPVVAVVATVGGLGGLTSLAGLIKIWLDRKSGVHDTAIKNYQDLNVTRETRIALLERQADLDRDRFDVRLASFAARLDASEAKERECELRNARLEAYFEYVVRAARGKLDLAPFDPSRPAAHTPLPPESSPQ